MERPKQRQDNRALIPPDPTSDFLQKPLTRRGFLDRASRVFAGTAIGISGGFTADTLVGNYIWGGTSPEIQTINNDEAKKRFPHTHTLVVGGYGVYDLPRLTDAISDTMTKYSQVSYLRPSNEGLQIEDLKRETDAFVQNNKVLETYLYGQSMGGMMAIELGAHLAQQGVKVNGVILDCSPMNYMDVRDVRRKKADVLISTDKLDLHGGPATRFGMEVVARWGEGRRDITKICEEALRKLAPNNCSNKLIQSQVRYLSQFNINDFANAFLPSTPFIHLRPDNILADTTIDNESSFKRLCNTFGNNTVIEAPVKGSAHANPSNCREAYNQTLQTVAKQCNFYDGPRLRGQKPV